MRRAPLLIALSLAANAALAVVLWQRSTSLSTHSDFSPASSPSPAAPRDPAAFAAHWKTLLQNPDDTAALSFLRASGFPPEVVRSLITERIRARYQPRFREHAAKQAEIPYWRTTAWYNFDGDVATRAARRALDREIQDTVRQLLGDDIETLSFYERERRARRYGNLPTEKVTELEAINRDYSELNAQIRENAKGVVLADDREKLAFLEKEKRADLAAILSPAELDEYDRRTSSSSSEIRGKLRYFDATEDEFVALYQAQRDFDVRYGRDNLSGEQNDRRKAALPQLAAQFKAALGPERYAEYEILSDNNYRDTRALLGSIGLPPEPARDLVVLHRATTRQADAIRKDKSLTPAEQTERLVALEKEATGKVVATIGAANLSDYQKNYTGGWLKKISQPTKPGAAR